MKLQFCVKISASVPYGYANGLSCVRCYAGTLSNTHAKAGQHHAELNDHFVDHKQISIVDCCNWWAMNTLFKY